MLTSAGHGPSCRWSGSGMPVPAHQGTDARVTVEGETVVMMTPQIAGIAVSDIGPVAASLAEHQHPLMPAPR